MGSRLLVLIALASVSLVTNLQAAATLTITPITWNVVGLDSNDVNSGPQHFPIGVRVTNTGSEAATNVTSQFVWDSTDTYINLRPGSLPDYGLTNSYGVSSLGVGASWDFYYEVEVTRNSLAYDHTRRYHITADADNAAQVSTSTPRELYVEHLISQSRNGIDDIRWTASQSLPEER
jgi:hypothetical protein